MAAKDEVADDIPALPVPQHLEVTLPCISGLGEVVDASPAPVRIVVLSDTHNHHDMVDVPDGDILIHCGDFTVKGTEQELRAFGAWASALPHKHKIFIAGNHDQGTVTAQLTSENASECIAGLSFMPLDSPGLIEICGIVFFCAGWVVQRGISIPPGIDVLITHGGPAGVLEGAGHHLSENWDGEGLLSAVARSPPRVHFFGHVHENGGKMQCGLTDDHPAGREVRAAVQNTVFVNCAQAERGFSPKKLVRGAVIFTITPLSPTARAVLMEHALPPAIQTAAVGDRVTIISPEANAGQHGEVLRVTGEGTSVRFRVKLDGMGKATWVDAVVKATD